MSLYPSWMRPVSRCTRGAVLVRHAFISILVVAIIIVASVVFGLFNRQAYLPINLYAASPMDSMVLPYPRSRNFGGDGFWLESTRTHPFSGKITGILWGSNRETTRAPNYVPLQKNGMGDSKPVKIHAIPGEGNLIFLQLPVRPSQDKYEYSPGYSLDLPVGLHHFSRLTLNITDRITQEYFIGNIWLEILPPEYVDRVARDEYSTHISERRGHNLAIIIRYFNASSTSKVFTGIHLPETFPYGIDEATFRVETKKVNTQGKTVLDNQAFEQRPYLSPTKRIIPDADSRFPQQVTVEPGSEVVISFTLAVTTENAFRFPLAINPIILKTINGRYVSHFSPPLIYPWLFKLN